MPPLLRIPAGPALLLLFALAATTHAQGKLDQIHDDVHDQHHTDDVDPFDDDEWLEDSDVGLTLFSGDPIGFFVEYTILIPFYLPRAALHDERLDPARFQHHPYDDGPGFWFAPDEVPSERTLSTHLAVETGTDFDDIERFGLVLRIEHASRFGLDLAWNRFREDVDPGGTDQLDLGDANLTYRFAQSARAAFRAGVGLNYLHDEVDSDAGINFTYAADFYPVDPLSAGFELDLGTLGDATLTHLRGTLGFVLEGFELYASYDHFGVDDDGLDSYGLGLRGWL